MYENLIIETTNRLKSARAQAVPGEQGPGFFS